MTNKKNSSIKVAKIVLIPPIVNPVSKRRKEGFMPLGLLALSASLISKNIEVVLYEPSFIISKKEDHLIVAQKILQHKPDLVGFSTWCISFPTSILLAREIKNTSPQSIILFGGPQASIQVFDTLRNFPFIDFLLAGEADNTIMSFIDALNQNNEDYSTIPGLAYRINGDTVKYNRDTNPVQNLDQLPVPAYDLLKNKNSIKLDVGRGCPYKCTYCSTNEFFSQTYRTKSPDRILNEMLEINKKWKVTSFSFAHDLFTLNEKFVFELCNKLIELKARNGIEFTWTCSSRIDCVSEKMLRTMREAGCHSIFFGVESGSPKIQKTINKNICIDKVYEVANLCIKHNYNAYFAFILGFPDETEQDVNETLQTMCKLAVQGVFVQVSELSLLPGTKLYDEHHKNLTYSGLFSNFSQTFCGEEERTLIKKYPKLFSSFYNLPVKTFDGEQLHLLCKVINKQHFFRDTLFLLSNHILKDISHINLHDTIIGELENISLQFKKHSIIEIFVTYLKSYIVNHRSNLNIMIMDVFLYEAYGAISMSNFSKWQLHNSATKRIPTQNSKIRPTPIWQKLASSYKLEKIIPSENKWNQNTNRVRRGKYNYLLVATSEVEFKRIKLNPKQVFLLENLSELSVKDYVKKVSAVLTEKECLLWIKKLRRLGVIEILEKE